MISLDINSLKDSGVVLTGFHFVEQNPLGFFEFDNIADKKEVFEKKTVGYTANGKITVKENGFKPVKDANGNNEANKDIFVVTRAKSRPVLILQDIDLCKQYHDNVFIIPIQTIKEPIQSKYGNIYDYNRDLAYYNKIKSRSDELPHRYYIPTTIDGNVWERELILNDARFVHVSTLYGQVIENSVSEKELKEIHNRLCKMLKIPTKEDCEKCEYLSMYTYIKKIISRVERLEGQKKQDA